LAEIRAKGIAEGQAEGMLKGREEGREQGAAVERKRWQQGNETRMRTADEGREFDEPPPGSQATRF